jgi:hypothetical protein
VQNVEVEIDDEVYLPCYRHLLGTKADINFLFGGRDSGKSSHVARQLVVKCLSEDYFRFILAKKTFNSIESAQWQTIKDVVEEWGLESLFEFKKSPLSIICANGNTFIARGFDDPAKLKSISNPSGVWIEEGNQITQEDYLVLSTTLRSNVGKVQEWITFNPECEEHYEDFWMVKMWPFLADYTTHNGVIEQKLPKGGTVSLTYTSTHTTYLDNPYCTPERQAKIEKMAAINPYYHDVFALGKWGRVPNDNPAAYCYERGIHVGHTTWNPDETTYISCDFNRNPMCWSVFQIYDDTLFGIETIKLANTGTPAMCDYLLQHYPGAIYMVTGDSSGDNANTLSNDRVTNYTIIRNMLQLGPNQLRVPRNPPVKRNIQLMNVVLKFHKCRFDPINCKHLIYDFENVRLLPTGDIDKSDRENPMKQADALDTFRYLCNTFFAHMMRAVE